MEPLLLLGLLGLGAWAALDNVALGQFMVSRPLVTGTLAGTLLGDPWNGFVLGALLEVTHLWRVPAGGARLPESGPAAIPGAVLAVIAPPGAGLAAGFVLALVLAALGGAGVVGHRRLIGGLLGPEAGVSRPARLRGVLLLGLTLDALRGALITGTGLAVALQAPTGLLARWPLDPASTLVLLLLGAALPAGTLARTLLPERASRRLLLAAGILLGAGAALMTGGFPGGGP